MWPTSGQVQLWLVEPRQQPDVIAAANNELNVTLVLLSGESAAAAFRDLSKLSRVFKDQLAYPLIAAAREGKHLEYNVNCQLLWADFILPTVLENIRTILEKIFAFSFVFLKLQLIYVITMR